MTNIRPNFSDLEANRLHVKSSEFIGSKAEKENLVRTRRQEIFQVDATPSKLNPCWAYEKRDDDESQREIHECGLLSDDYPAKLLGKDSIYWLTAADSIL
ncbi:hypothetical protein GTR04_6069 [Trichophyton interdigitale]|nr:hypothetical protein GY631_5969 [Trichophyton interdigitale]KAG5218087.1 hypothetical protein GY632_5911 [Trichophyton interdigitale]KAG8206543.1 hypothetical protein GTR04_6069 [Trichophyton interdigitale]